MTRITQDPADWQAGYNAGLSDGSSDPLPEVVDRLAFASGYVEGKAKRADQHPSLDDVGLNWWNNITGVSRRLG